ncbi:MAG TPA: FemAB family XrtA/PEP-CTERM system-associated protein [Gemmatimonadales bacterium]
MTIVVDRFTGDGAEWDACVRGSGGWTHFHLYDWKSVIERVFGHECLYLACRTGAGDLVGVLPLVRVRSRIFGHYLVSMPFVNYGGPLGTSDAVRALATRAAERATADGVDLLELRSRVDLPLGLPVSHRKITVMLDLPSGNPEPLWKALSAKVRSQVRRPQKEGVRVVFGLDQVESFYHVYARHMRDLGTPVQSRRFFETLAETFADSMWVGCAYLDDRPIACGCGFRWDREFEMTWASSLREHNRIAPNMLLYWAFMERCVDQQVAAFNFGRCTPGGGTHRFKRQWGSRDEPLWWYQHSQTKGAGKRATPSPDDAAFSWGPRLWRYLPVPLANLMGPRIVRSVP